MSAIENALNAFISLDPNISEYLSPLANKTIAITILPFNETIYLCPSTDSIQLLDYSSDKADTTLTGSVFAFGLMGTSASPMRSIFSGDVTIEGDMQTGKRFQALFAKLDLNLEPLIAQYTGNTVANSLGQFFQSSKSWSEQTAETFKLNIAELLTCIDAVIK